MLIEFDDDVLFGAGNNGTKAELWVFNLSSLREGWFKCHCGGIPLLVGQMAGAAGALPAYSIVAKGVFQRY
jgi:hypothetical protein